MSHLYRSTKYAWAVLLISCTEIPQITKFSASPTVLQGDKARFEWEVTPNKSIKSVEIFAVKDKLPVSGAIEIQPLKSQDYQLIVRYKKGGKTLQINQNVSVQVKDFEAAFQVTPQIYMGEEAEIKWKVSPHTENVKLEEVINELVVNKWDKLPTEAQYDIKPLRNTSYRLYLTQNGITKTLEHTVQVNPAFFTGTREVLEGEEAELIWKVSPRLKNLSLEKRENSYTREVIAQNLTSQGYAKTRPTNTTEYLLSLVGDNHTAFLHKVEVVQGILLGTKSIIEGDPAVLSWRCSPKASRIWLEAVRDGKPNIIYAGLSPEGRLELKPTATTEFKLMVEMTETEDLHQYDHIVQVKPQNKAYTSEQHTYTYRNNTMPHIYQASAPVSANLQTLGKVNTEPVVIEPMTVNNNQYKIFFDFNKNEIRSQEFTQLDALIT
jgi:hypothetical protein